MLSNSLFMFEYRAYMQVDGQKTLIANFSSTLQPPKVGDVNSIRWCKEADKYPSLVKILNIAPLRDEDTPEMGLAYYLLVEAG